MKASSVPFHLEVNSLSRHSRWEDSEVERNHSAMEDRFKKIKAFVFDVDGVLTDGGLLADLNGEFYRRIDFVFTRQSGILKLLKKKSAGETPKTIRQVKKTKTQDVSDDVRDIFDELQDDYERDGEYHTGFGGCYGEDDRESEYYNPTHPYDD